MKKAKHVYNSKANKHVVLEINEDELDPNGEPVIVEIPVEEYERKTGKKVKEGVQD